MRIGKITAGLAVLTLMGTMVLPVYAQDKKTELTAEIQSTYTLSIPSTQEIELGELSTAIGAVGVTGNIRPEEKVVVKAEKTKLISKNRAADVIEYRLHSNGIDFEGQEWSEEMLRSGTPTTCPLTVDITQEAWNKAHAGDYSATITFTVDIKS